MSLLALRPFFSLQVYFFDYNTVETVLLGCAVLVCLSGVMFENERFQVCAGRASEEKRLQYECTCMHAGTMTN